MKTTTKIKSTLFLLLIVVVVTSVIIFIKKNDENNFQTRFHLPQTNDIIRTATNIFTSSTT
jgi:hypothetical protein